MQNLSKELTQSFPPTGLASNKRSRITSPIVWSQILISQKVAALHTLRLGAGVLSDIGDFKGPAEVRISEAEGLRESGEF